MADLLWTQAGHPGGGTVSPGCGGAAAQAVLAAMVAKLCTLGVRTTAYWPAAG